MTENRPMCKESRCQEPATYELKWDTGGVFVCDKHLPDNHAVLRSFTRIERLSDKENNVDPDVCIANIERNVDQWSKDGVMCDYILADLREWIFLQRCKILLRELRVTDKSKTSVKP